jgi:hypothetical protein
MASNLAAAPELQSRGGVRFGLWMRRSHMYLGLFLTPWLLMYALSTLVFNHFSRIEKIYNGKLNQYEHARSVPYRRAFGPGVSLRVQGEAILEDLHDSGSFGIHESEGKIIIDRRDPFGPRRFTYTPAEGKVVIEQQAYRTATMLTMLHTQVGYVNKLGRIKTWAVTVDLTTITMVLLVLTGVWMWWELKITRGWGAVFLLGGMALFGIFLKFA